MKANPTMQTFVQQLGQRHGVDLTPVGAYLRLDLPEQDSLVLDHLAPTQMAVTHCFAECGEWQIEREVVFFTGYDAWLAIECTQLVTGWHACAKLDITGQRLVRLNHCDQERLADFVESWARQLMRQHWLDQGVRYATWTPPARKEWL